MLFSTLINDAEFLDKNPKLFSDIEDAIEDESPDDSPTEEFLKISAELKELELEGQKIEKDLANYVLKVRQLAASKGVFVNEKVKRG